jgi:hypothetical protein
MFQVASGSGLSVGLVGADGPPLSPETVGRSPGLFEAPPVPLKPFAEMAAEVAASAPPAPASEEPDDLPPAAGARRLVVRLLGGEELDLGAYDGRDAAVTAAQDLIARFAAAETAGDWPEVEGRFIRPGSVASIDVLTAA